MIRKIPFSTVLYDPIYDNDFPENQYYVTIFDDVPSKFSDKYNYHISIEDYFLSLGFKMIWKLDLDKRHSGSMNSKRILIDESNKILIKLDYSILKSDDSLTIEFLYSLENGEITEQIDFSSLKKYILKKKRANINLVTSDMGHLDTQEYDLIIPDINLKLNYGKDFEKIHNIIIKRLNTNRDKGIILLHGEPGSGKSTYLKYITKFITDKDVLFIPPSMAEMLSEPSIIPFLIEHKNSILIIEDAERVISDRDSGHGSSAGVSNILNLTDGILGDCLNIQIIATFNTKRERIDSALLRKGRLIIEHKFESLSVEDTNKLLKHLKKDVISEIGLPLSDIYNIDSDDVRITKEPYKIGFKI